MVTLSLITFIAVGASWQLAASAAGSGWTNLAATLRAEPAARGGVSESALALDAKLSRSTVSGAALILGGGIPVALVDSGSVRRFRAPRGASVADVVALSGVALGPLDQVLPADGTAKVDPGAVVRVLRVVETTAVLKESMPYGVQAVPDASLLTGRTVVAKAGAPGLAENTYRVTTVDGAEASRVLLATVEVVAPTPEVRRVGTAAPAPVAAPGEIQNIITAAAARWGADPNQLLRVAYCESRYNPNAYNASSGASGLFQFLASTWSANSVRAGYGGASVFDPVANANTAAMMFANGQARQWACK